MFGGNRRFRSGGRNLGALRNILFGGFDRFNRIIAADFRSARAAFAAARPVFVCLRHIGRCANQCLGFCLRRNRPRFDDGDAAVRFFGFIAAISARTADSALRAFPDGIDSRRIGRFGVFGFRRFGIG